MAVHAVLGASSSPIWMECAEGGRALGKATGSTSIYAATGTLAHSLVEIDLTGGNSHNMLGQMHSVGGFDIEVTQEMLDAVDLYVNYVLMFGLQRSDVHIEEKVSLAALWANATPPQPVFGTADAIIHVGDHLHVFDFKYGSGVPIEASSFQLVFYALGALLASKGHVEDVTVHVVQPRAPHIDGPIRKHTYTVQQLMSHGNMIVAQVNLISSGGGGFISGKHCRFCPAAGWCPELALVNTQLATTDFPDPVDPGPMPPNMLSHDELGFIMDRIPIFDSWIRGVENEALVRMMNGQKIPGFKLVEKRATRKWTMDDEDILDELKTILGESSMLVTKVAALSPTQSEKKLGKGLWKRVLDAGLVDKKSSGLTIASMKDRRDEVTPVEGALVDFQESDPDADIPF